MISKYRIWFEGLPDPVFYKSYYPVGGNDAEWLWDLFNYAQGLKHDKDREERKLNEWHDQYAQDLRELFNAVMAETPHSKRGVVVIPSSEKDATNRATALVREVLFSNPKPFADLTKIVIRSEDKQKAHDSGQRSFQTNYQTLEVIDKQLVRSLDIIVVIDDILTSGTSFRAMDQRLKDAGFAGTIYNFAFARTTPVDAIKNILNHESGLIISGFDRINALPRTKPSTTRVIRSGFQVTLDDGKILNFDGHCVCTKRACYKKAVADDGTYKVEYDPTIVLDFGDGMSITFEDEADVRRSFKNITYVPEIEGIVFDFDQTLVDDSIRDIVFEEKAGKAAAQVCPYRPYAGIRELMELGIPFSIVSNRPQKELTFLIRNREIENALYPGGYWDNEDNAYYSRLSIIEPGHDGCPDTVLIKIVSLPKNVFSFPNSKDASGYSCKYYKPCIQGINRAISFLYEDFDLPKPKARIIGLGNTPEDIIAYNTADIESCLALWGVPDYLKEYASAYWGAAHVFCSVQEFTEWCRNGGYDLA